MASPTFTLTSYEPVYAVCPEVRIPEEIIREQALRWLQSQIAKEGETAKLTDSWVNAHCEDFKNVEELMIFIRYNVYRDNREIQQLADQDVICRELSKRLVEELPADLVDECVEDYCADRGISEEKLYADTEERAIQSLKEDSALAAYAAHMNYTLEPDDFYAIIPGNSIQEKAHKRRQIELEGRLAPMEEYARKTKALREIMENAMIKRRETDQEWLRYGDTAADVLQANKQFPDSFISLG